MFLWTVALGGCGVGDLPIIFITLGGDEVGRIRSVI